MNNRTLLTVAVVIIVVGGIAYAMGHRNAEPAPQGVIGNALAGVGDKIDQATEQMKADSHEQSANNHFDAAKAGMGIDTNK